MQDELCKVSVNSFAHSRFSRYNKCGVTDLWERHFSAELSVSEKLEIVEFGEEKGKEEMITRMYEKGYSLEQITDISENGINEIRVIIENREPVEV